MQFSDIHIEAMAGVRRSLRMNTRAMRVITGYDTLLTRLIVDRVLRSQVAMPRENYIEVNSGA